MTSAAAKPASKSPSLNSSRLATFDALSGFGSTPPVRRKSCNTGASGFIASSTSITWGRTSYSTSINAKASCAFLTDVAATAATACPAYNTLSRAKILRLTKRMSAGPTMTGVSKGNSTISSEQITDLTPGAALAFSRLMDIILACGCGLRSTLPHNIPGRLKSAPKVARPVTLSAPSGRIVRLPIHLLSMLLPSMPNFSLFRTTLERTALPLNFHRIYYALEKPSANIFKDHSIMIIRSRTCTNFGVCLNLAALSSQKEICRSAKIGEPRRRFAPPGLIRRRISRRHKN